MGRLILILLLACLLGLLIRQLPRIGFLIFAALLLARPWQALLLLLLGYGIYQLFNNIR